MEQGAGDGIFLQRYPRVVFLDEFFKCTGVAYVNQAEVVFRASGLQAKLSGAASHVTQVQAAARRRVEHLA